MLTFETKNPSLGMICPGDPHQRNPNAPKFEDRSHQETEWQERCAREAALRLAKSILKLKEKNKAAFLSPSENWCLLAPSNIKPEEREFVVDSGASMHKISKKDLNSAEMDTLTTSRSPTTKRRLQVRYGAEDTSKDAVLRYLHAALLANFMLARRLKALLGFVFFSTLQWHAHSSLQSIDLSQGWSSAVTDHFIYVDLSGHDRSRLHLRQAAFYSATNLPSRDLPQLLAAFAALL